MQFFKTCASVAYAAASEASDTLLAPLLDQCYERSGECNDLDLLELL
jgi:hypothetical protein